MESEDEERTASSHPHCRRRTALDCDVPATLARVWFVISWDSCCRSLGYDTTPKSMVKGAEKDRTCEWQFYIKIYVYNYICVYNFDLWIISSSLSDLVPRQLVCETVSKQHIRHRPSPTPSAPTPHQSQFLNEIFSRVRVSQSTQVHSELRTLFASWAVDWGRGSLLFCLCFDFPPTEFPRLPWGLRRYRKQLSAQNLNHKK